MKAFWCSDHVTGTGAVCPGVFLCSVAPSGIEAAYCKGHLDLGLDYIKTKFDICLQTDSNFSEL